VSLQAATPKRKQRRSICLSLHRSYDCSPIIGVGTRREVLIGTASLAGSAALPIAAPVAAIAASAAPLEPLGPFEVMTPFGMISSDLPEGWERDEHLRLKSLQLALR